MGQIAEAVGVGRPALYHYFPSKDDLVAATIQAAVDRYESFGSIPEKSSFDEAVRYSITRLVHNIAGADEAPLRFFYTVLLEQFGAPADQQPVRAIIDSYRQQVADLVRFGQETGEVPPDVDPSLIADRLTVRSLACSGCGCSIAVRSPSRQSPNSPSRTSSRPCRRAATDGRRREPASPDRQTAGTGDSCTAF